MGGAFSQLAAQKAELLGLTGDKLAVLKEAHDTPPQWLHVGGPADSICASDHEIYGLRGDSVLRLSGQVALLQQPRPSTSIANVIRPKIVARSLDEKPPTDIATRWLFVFYTKDALWAGYDGHVFVGAGRTQSNSGWTATLKTTSIQRGEVVTEGLDFPDLDKLDLDDGLTLISEWNFFGDSWTIDRIVAWNYWSRAQYEFDVDQDVPNMYEGYDPLKVYPARKRRITAVPTPVYVYFWDYQVWATQAVGHSSMYLPRSDTYISWWPDNTSPEMQQVLGLDWRGPPQRSRTYAEDHSGVTGEGKPPDTVVPIYGLDEPRIKAWWDQFKADPGSEYYLWGCNCSSVVYLGLKAGGILNKVSDKVRRDVETVEPWAPYWITRLATLAQTGVPEWPFSDEV